MSEMILNLVLVLKEKSQLGTLGEGRGKGEGTGCEFSDEFVAVVGCSF